LSTRSIGAHEPPGRGPRGESAWAVLSLVDEENLYEFDMPLRGDSGRGPPRPAGLAIDHCLPNAVYHPLTYIGHTVAAASEDGFLSENIVFEITEG
jgi:hypothetical protein